MIDIKKACELAEEYFQNMCGTGYAERILENSDSWFFSSGKAGAVRYGSIIISVKKVTGEIRELPMPSHETIQILKEAELVRH